MIRKTFITALIVSAVIIGFSAIHPFDPALSETHKFERRFHLSARFPFFTSYLLLTPPQYDPDTKYPMIVALHGGYKRSLAAFVAAQDKFQQRFPAFVLMPMAQFRQLWAIPPGSKGQLGVTEALPTAIDVMNGVIEEFSIDPGRIYVTGSSNGAVGTFAAMVRYPELFAAGVAVNGRWPADNAKAFTGATLAIYHGSKDPVYPVQQMHLLVDAIRAAGGRPKFVEMTGTGHDSRPAYRDPNLWEWLLNQ